MDESAGLLLSLLSSTKVVLYGALPLAIVLFLLDRLSRPTLFLVSRYVRPVRRQDLPWDQELRPHPRLRIWVQNADGTQVPEPSLVFLGDVIDVRVVGGVGRFRPVVQRNQNEVDGSWSWTVSCVAGMRAHATWRVELDLGPEFSEVEVRALGYQAFLGRENTIRRLGHLVSLPVFSLFAATIGAVAFITVMFLTDGGPGALATAVGAMATLSWSGVLFLFIRPRQVGIMSGMGGTGGSTRFPAPDPKPEVPVASEAPTPAHDTPDPEDSGGSQCSDVGLTGPSLPVCQDPMAAAVGDCT